MNNRKEELVKKYWQMKKETKAAKSKEDEMLAVLVDASQDAVKVVFGDKYYNNLNPEKHCSNKNICAKPESIPRRVR